MNAICPGLIETVFDVPGGKMIVEITGFEPPAEDKWDEEQDMVRRQLEYFAKEQFVAAWKEAHAAAVEIVARTVKRLLRAALEEMLQGGRAAIAASASGADG